MDVCSVTDEALRSCAALAPLPVYRPVVISLETFWHALCGLIPRSALAPHGRRSCWQAYRLDEREEIGVVVRRRENSTRQGLSSFAPEDFARWERFNHLRTGLELAGWSCLCLAALTEERG
ncbi:MAG TPA: hypothetical protein VF818_02270 [Ktedonobacterales bacterium]